MAAVEAFEGLKQWALLYVKHRDIPVKKITNIKDADYGFVIANNDGTATSCVIQPSFKAVSSQFAKSVMIVTLSNEDNIKAVYGVWDALAANPVLLIVFANPFSAQEEKWVLKPFLHNKVCDRASLLQGLKAMAELVEPIDEEAFSARLREPKR